jgi:hypothetical protein
MCAISMVEGTGFKMTLSDRFNHSLSISARITAVLALVASAKTRN